MTLCRTHVSLAVRAATVGVRLAGDPADGLEDVDADARLIPRHAARGGDGESQEEDDVLHLGVVFALRFSNELI